jgi:putative acyl-CoA dehydrogenase
LTEYNLFTSDIGLKEAVQREGAGWDAAELTSAGGELGSPELAEHARLASASTLSNFTPPGMH